MIQRRTALLGLAAAALAAPALAKGKRKAGFKTIFDGKSLDGWTPIGDANWTLKDGVASADKGRGMLVSQASYKDFDLRAEVWVSPEANSGIFIRCSDRATVTQNNAYEVNIYDTRPDPAYGTGAIVDVAKVSPMPKAGGRWNVIEISAHGDVLSVVFNGQKTVDAVRNSLYAEGPIALQYGAGVVRFRRVDIRTA
jgi:hypothetical protein